jgi:superfamily II DNA or RNA helicase
MNYKDFIKKKGEIKTNQGIPINNIKLNTSLFPFQQFIVKTALNRGKYAIFADCGLGKTFMQLEWAKQINIKTEKPVLILAPLAVTKQTINEGLKFNIEVGEINSGKIEITNYEQIDNISCNKYSGIVLDESSILKNFNSKTKEKIIKEFKKTPYKLACTATPSPNDPMELGNHAEFLDIMSRNEMLAMYFIHDGGNTSKWRLKKHSISLFYKFVSTWAIMLNNPKDIL